jgi:hypothetical protein
MTTNRIRSKFAKAIRDVTVYREQEEGYAEDDVSIGLDSVFHVATETETKKLKGRNVEAVLFTIGSSPGWFWMPKIEFVQSTEPHDIKSQTGTPHEL